MSNANCLTEKTPSSVDAGDAVDKKLNVRQNLQVLTSRLQFFLSGEDECFAELGDQQHIAIPVKSPAFRGYLGQTYLARFTGIPSKREFDDFIERQDAVIRYSKSDRKVEVFHRIGWVEGKVYVDLGDETGKVVEITASGWRTTRECPIKFRRTPQMLCLPTPMGGGSIDELRAFVNAPNADDFQCIVGFLLGTLMPKGPYPMLEVTGEHGAAKSTTCEFIQRVIDPNKMIRRAAPRDEETLAIAFRNAWLVNFDNVSSVSTGLSDILCRALTGGAFTRRTLYSNEGETVFQYERPVIMNGIPDLARRADLLDRSLPIHLSRIERTKRRTEDELRADFDEAHPRILGALLDAVSMALRNRTSVKHTDWPRLADFCKWVTAGEGSFGWPPLTFVHVMAHKEVSAAQRALADEEFLLKRLLEVVQAAGPNGLFITATDLLDLLKQHQSAECQLPKAANILARKLRELAPPLKTIGIDVRQLRQGAESRKMFHLVKVERRIDRIDRIDRTNCEE